VAASGGILAGLEGEFTDLDGYYAAALARKPAINNMMLVGHNTVRSLVMGDNKGIPSDVEMQQMQQHVSHALEQGACGFLQRTDLPPGPLQ
jgi:N-acyl-D-aspartate/D-glutamate deacylase